MGRKAVSAENPYCSDPGYVLGQQVIDPVLFIVRSKIMRKRTGLIPGNAVRPAILLVF